MYLREWLMRQRMEDPKFRVEKFAQSLGMTANHLWNIANYRYQASVKFALLIEVATNGMVEPWPQMLKCHEEYTKMMEQKKSKIKEKHES
jgi:hypothetical protein